MIFKLLIALFAVANTNASCLKRTTQPLNQNNEVFTNNRIPIVTTMMTTTSQFPYQNNKVFTRDRVPMATTSMPVNTIASTILSYTTGMILTTTINLSFDLTKVVTTTTTIATTTLRNIVSYHICPRSMNTYLLLIYNIHRNCEGGPSANLCSGNSMCPPSARACCQQTNGCNRCVVPCPLRPIPPTNCLNGFTPYNSPTGCVKYVCNEKLSDLQAADAVAVDIGLKQRSEFGFAFTTAINFI